MPQIINTNIASLTAQRNLNTSQNDLNTSLQRLSSGLRINSAKDDAAGLAISERFTTQIRGLNQAQRNANDGISLAQTAEGDLAAITNNLQRIRELAVQSANATNSSSDRAALQLETSELIAEIDRVASISSFNGVKLLDGNFASQQFQVGANSGETVSISNISSARTSALGQTDSATFTSAVNVTGALTTGDLSINGNDIVAAGDAKAIADAITSSSSNVTATATNSQTGVTFTDSVGTAGSAAIATTYSFGAYTEAQSDGTAAEASVFTGAAVGTNGTTALDYSTNTGLSFDITVDGTGGAKNITITGNHATQADLLNEINTEFGVDSVDAVASIVGGNLVITSNATGLASDIAISNISSTATNGLDLVTTGSETTVGADAIAPTDGTFQLTVDGLSVYSEAASIGGAVTAAELTSALGTFATNNATEYSFSGTVGVDAQLSKLDGTAVTVAFGTNFSGQAGDFAAAINTTGSVVSPAVLPAYTLTLDGTAVDLTAAKADGTVTGFEVATAIGNLGTFTSSYDGTDLTITKLDGGNFTIADTGADSDGAEGLAGGAASAGTSTTYTGTLSVTSQDADLVIAGATPGNAGLAAGVGTTPLTGVLSGVTVANTDISTVTGANDALVSIDAALSSINTSRASLGAIQNRFESVVTSIQTTSENLSAARSRIRDADFAEETAALTRAQILQQAGVSILSQANSLPQNVLALLQ